MPTKWNTFYVLFIDDIHVQWEKSLQRWLDLLSLTVGSLFFLVCSVESAQTLSKPVNGEPNKKSEPFSDPFSQWKEEVWTSSSMLMSIATARCTVATCVLFSQPIISWLSQKYKKNIWKNFLLWEKEEKEVNWARSDAIYKQQNYIVQRLKWSQRQLKLQLFTE